LPYLDPAVLATLDFDPTDQLQPTLLHRDMFHPDLRGLTFIGHYRGPYLPVMELQSRWIARILAGELPMPDRAAMQAGIEEARRLRAQFPRPQFPHGDFVGLADGLAREVGVYPELEQGDPLWARVVRGPLVPAHYRLVGSHAEPGPAREVIAATPTPILDDPSPSGPVASARRVLDLLRGDWTIERQIEPGGSFAGSATFTQRTTDSLLYHESGRLVLDDGTALDGHNSYIYAQRNDAVELSFTDGLSRGVHFFDIALPQGRTIDLPIRSVDQHLCRCDTYDVTFCFEKPDLFTLTYVVRGPEKSYVSCSIYRRLERSA
jgi:hypothetical protein